MLQRSERVQRPAQEISHLCDRSTAAGGSYAAAAAAAPAAAAAAAFCVHNGAEGEVYARRRDACSLGHGVHPVVLRGACMICAVSVALSGCFTQRMLATAASKLCQCASDVNRMSRHLQAG